jgi:hypothetical protein
MPADLADLRFEGATRPTSTLLSAIKYPVVGVLGITTVIAVVALPDPLPRYPVSVYALRGILDGIGLAITAEHVVFRPTQRFRFRRALETVGRVAGAVLTFVVAMALLGVGMTLRDWALLGGVCVSVPASLAIIDYLKDRVRAELVAKSR